MKNAKVLSRRSAIGRLGVPPHTSPAGMSLGTPAWATRIAPSSLAAGAGRDARNPATLSDIFRFIRCKLSTGRFSPRIMRRTSAVRAKACSTPNA